MGCERGTKRDRIDARMVGGPRRKLHEDVLDHAAQASCWYASGAPARLARRRITKVILLRAISRAESCPARSHRGAAVRMIIRRVNSQIESGGATGKNSPNPDRAVKISEITAENATPMTIPAMPPVMLRMTASARNWSSTWSRQALVNCQALKCLLMARSCRLRMSTQWSLFRAKRT
jgi:hypothetical protein